IEIRARTVGVEVVVIQVQRNRCAGEKRLLVADAAGIVPLNQAVGIGDECGRLRRGLMPEARRSAENRVKRGYRRTTVRDDRFAAGVGGGVIAWGRHPAAVLRYAAGTGAIRPILNGCGYAARKAAGRRK